MEGKKGAAGPDYRGTPQQRLCQEDEAGLCVYEIHNIINRVTGQEKGMRQNNDKSDGDGPGSGKRKYDYEAGDAF